MSKKYLRNDEPCPACGSKRGPCNMWQPKIKEPTQISIAGHCCDCGYSFTRIYDLMLVETIERDE